MVDAKISIYDLQEAIDIKFPNGRDYDTLGGFILDQVKNIPKKNDVIKFNNITFCVKTISNNRIGKINIIK
jgi:CBS domain containing-hemolysin-like protein